MKNIDEVVENKKCTGCSACLNICPKDAIYMGKDAEGFLVPRIDAKKCIHCGLCNKVCPALNGTSKENQYSLPKVYAGWNKDEKVRLKSSSGGVFSVLAEYFLKKKGYVCGASFDEKNKLGHIIISSKKDLEKLRGSKYVQSEIGDIYKRIKKLLENNKWVLFSGTPCQAAGLKNYLGKEYEKLLVLDIICHGVPSPSVFKEYLKEVEEQNKKKISEIKFRDKSLGWKSPQLVLGTEGGENLIKKVLYDDIYGRGFLTNLYLRPACTDCKYSKWPKISDITLGDFWGIWKYKPELDDNKGTSLIMINNKKGQTILDEIKELLISLEEIPPEIAINNNYPVFISSDKHVNRDDFFNDFSENNKETSKLILKYLDDENQGVNSSEKCVGLLNFHYENYNFGANLVAYSLQKVIEKLGYKVKVVNYDPFPEQSVIDKFCSLNFYKFRQNFLRMTKICKTKDDLVKTNKQFDTFITGSDQVWRQLITGENALHYFLDFTLSSKKRISYGASFGNNCWDGDEVTTREAKTLLKNFDFISVREREGLDILSDIFDIKNATCVLDPTLLLAEEDYEDLVMHSDIKKFDENYIAYYFLFDKKGGIEHGKKMEEISMATNCKVINVQGEEAFVVGEKRFVYDSFPNFINNIKNSKFVITDSFHGVLFSIIYRKNFVCVGKGSKALSRFENLFSLLEIDVNGRFVNTLEEIGIEIFSKKINYKMIYRNLNREKKKSLKFLEDSLKTKKLSGSIIHSLEEEILDLQVGLKELSLNNKTLHVNIQDLESQNQILNSKNSILLVETEKLESKISKLIEEITSLKNSKSWKLTMPFRKAVHLLKLFKSQGFKRTLQNIFLKVKNFRIEK